MEVIEKLIEVVRKKNLIDTQHDWSDGSATYIDALRKELLEVEEELPLDRICYLEDELGDVLWDYLSILVCLEEEKGVDIGKVFSRALLKYDERISGIQAGVSWKDTKAKQKEKMLVEYEEYNASSNSTKTNGTKT